MFEDILSAEELAVYKGVDVSPRALAEEEVRLLAVRERRLNRWLEELNKNVGTAEGERAVQCAEKVLDDVQALQVQAIHLLRQTREEDEEREARRQRRIG